jgi:hypothetical protein
MGRGRNSASAAVRSGRASRLPQSRARVLHTAKTSDYSPAKNRAGANSNPAGPRPSGKSPIKARAAKSAAREQRLAAARERNKAQARKQRSKRAKAAVKARKSGKA